MHPFVVGDLVTKTGGKYGGPGVIRGVYFAGDGTPMVVVGHQILGGYGEFQHVYPAKIVEKRDDPASDG